MVFNLFKKKKQPKEVVKEIVKVPVESRFTFANPNTDNEIDVCNYHINFNCSTMYTDLNPNDVFEYDYITDNNGNHVHFIFKMPKSLPVSRLVSNKKILCVGTLIVNPFNNNEIVAICNDYNGWSLEEIAAHCNIQLPDTDTCATHINIECIIEDVNTGKIDFETLSRYILVRNFITSVMCR